MKQRIPMGLAGVTAALVCAAAAHAESAVRPGTEWRYAGEASRTLGTATPTVQRFTVWATVVGRADGRPEVIRYRHLSEGAVLAQASAVWQTAAHEENEVLPSALPMSPEVRLVDSLSLPMPFGGKLEPGETKIARVPLFGYPPPSPQTLPVRRRVVGMESVNGRACLRVERILVARLPLQATFLLLAYREQLWVERDSGALVKFEANAQVQDGNAPGTGPVTLSATLRLEEVRTLTDSELRQRREQGQRLAAATDLLAQRRGEPSEGRLLEAQRRLEAFRREESDSPYQPAVAPLEELARRLKGSDWENARREARGRSRMWVPALRLKDLDGKEHSLDDYRGKWILLNWFASWSHSCDAEAPRLEKECWQRLRDRGLVVIGLNTAELDDPVRKARGFRDQHQLTYPILIDADGKARKAFGVTVLPTNMVIDPEGRIRYYEPGFNPDLIDQIVHTLPPAGKG